jgi:hypothetical protein
VERSNQAVDMSDGISAASPHAAIAAKSGTLSISTDPSPLVFTIFNHSMTAVAQGVSPAQIQLAAGLYMVRVPRAGYPDLVQLAWVVSNATRSVYLSDGTPNGLSAWASAFSRQFDERFRKLPALPPPGGAQTARRPNAPRAQFWIRFCDLADWNTSKPIELPRFSSRYDQDEALIEITNPHQRVIFAQIARPDVPTVNVAIPLAGALRAARCELVVSAGVNFLEAHVRLSTDWANSALQYMTQGYVEEAKQLVLSASKDEPSGFAWLLAKVKSRFQDPAAALVPRYLGLRSGEANIFNTFGDFLLDTLQQDLADGFVVQAEVAARQRQYRMAAQSILKIRPGALPLFTEGFSVLIHRIRDMVDQETLDSLHPDQRPVRFQIKRLDNLMHALNKWAPFLNLISPTVTFRGADLTAPDGLENGAIPKPAKPEPNKLK